MNRRHVCQMIVELRKGPLTADQLAALLQTSESNAREWLYELEAFGLVKHLTDTVSVPTPGRRLRRARLWQWVFDRPGVQERSGGVQ